MIKKIVALVWIGFALNLEFVSAAEDKALKSSDGANFEYKTVTTKEGLVFRVPDDMPIEERSGVQAPIPFDEYVYGKFKKMENRFKALNERMDRLEKDLELLKPAKEKEKAILKT